MLGAGDVSSSSHSSGISAIALRPANGLPTPLGVDLVVPAVLPAARPATEPSSSRVSTSAAATSPPADVHPALTGVLGGGASASTDAGSVREPVPPIALPWRLAAGLSADGPLVGRPGPVGSSAIGGCRPCCIASAVTSATVAAGTVAASPPSLAALRPLVLLPDRRGGWISYARPLEAACGYPKPHKTKYLLAM